MPDHTKHTRMIQGILDMNPGVQKKGFLKALKELSAQEDWWDVELDDLRFRPDAYKINHEARAVEIHEAVNTHLPKANTLNKMAMLWFMLDCESDWTVKLFVHLEGGSAPSEVDLEYWYYDVLAKIEPIAA